MNLLAEMKLTFEVLKMIELNSNLFLECLLVKCTCYKNLQVIY